VKVVVHGQLADDEALILAVFAAAAVMSEINFYCLISSSGLAICLRVVKG
jgi:hypothetical protein